MREKDENELNEEMSKEKTIETYKIEVSNYIKSLEAKGYKIIGAKFGNIPLTENFSTGDLSCIIEISKGTKSKFIILGSNLDQIGQVKSDGEIELEEWYKEEQSQHLKENGFEKYDTLDEKHFLKNSKEGDLEAISEKEHKEELTKQKKEMKKISKDIGDNGLGEPLQVVELDYLAAKEYSKLDNKINPKAGKIVLVKYPGNRWITAQEGENGYKQVAGIECSKLNREIVDALNITVYSQRGVEGKYVTAGEKNDDAYADFLYLKPTDTLDKGDIINYNRWGETERDLVDKKTGKKVELVEPANMYPQKIEIGNELIEVEEKNKEDEELENEENVKTIHDRGSKHLY